VGAYSFKTNP